MTTIRFSYGITKPSEVSFAGERFDASVEVEVDDAIDTEMALANLATDVKLFVITQAGMSAATDENGVISAAFVGRPVAPVVPISSAPSAPPNQWAAAPAPSPYATDPGDQVPFDATAPAPPAAAPAAQAGGVPNQWDGRPVTIYDNRPKKASGEHQPNAADFAIRFNDVGPDAPNDVKYKSIWIKNRNGSINDAGVALAAAFDGA